MKIRTKIILASCLTAGAVCFAAPASAQATRTWVSGVGDDVNPCSRTAPCKTFAGAISKTAAGGEINCLDPGGFGAVTITKSMTIACQYTEGGALAGGNGIVVNAGPTDVVVIRGLDIFGVNPPTNGIRFIAGRALHVEDTTIRRFNAVNSQGISFQPSGQSSLYVSNTTITHNGNGATGGGILIQPTGAAGTARVTLSNVRLQHNANNAIRVDSTGNSGPPTFVSVEDSSLSGSTNGLTVISPVGASTLSVHVNGSTIAYHVANGLSADGANAGVQVGDSTIVGNANAAAVANTASIRTFGDNRLVANGSNGTMTLLAKQ